MRERQVMPNEVFAGLGEGKLAYVRTMTSDDVKTFFPEAPEITPGVPLWALLGADGVPLMLSDSRDAVVQNAWEHDLVTVSLH